MRLYHKDLITVLPRMQLLGQWRELSAIASNINKKGTPNHILVNKIMDYPMNDFVSYAFYVQKEIYERGYKTKSSTWKNIESVCNDINIFPLDDIYINWHNKDYLQICYWNLKEKYLCGGIPKEEWLPIFEYMRNILSIAVL